MYSHRRSINLYRHLWTTTGKHTTAITTVVVERQVPSTQQHDLIRTTLPKQLNVNTTTTDSCYFSCCCCQQTTCRCCHSCLLYMSLYRCCCSGASSSSIIDTQITDTHFLCYNTTVNSIMCISVYTASV
eukprot:GHVS01041149.1.p1 GENE.GHVS01041149.1~~GHVS01041149.1.p1  ORF type:complete len:129 (+),score=28.55 GHVS01041149.1:14-400(+)